MIAYLFTLTLLIALPQAYWSRLSQFLLNFRHKSAQGFFIYHQGEKLYDQLSSLSLGTKMVQDFSPYKGFHLLANRVLVAHIQQGKELKPILNDLKKFLVLDLRFEKRVVKQLQSQWVQSLFSIVMIWLFIAASISILKIKPSTAVLMVVFALNIKF